MCICIELTIAALYYASSVVEGNHGFMKRTDIPGGGVSGKDSVERLYEKCQALSQLRGSNSGYSVQQSPRESVYKFSPSMNAVVSHLTKFARWFLINEYLLSSRYVVHSISDQYIEIEHKKEKTRRKIYIVNGNYLQCECGIWEGLNLPCRHVLSFQTVKLEDIHIRYTCLYNIRGNFDPYPIIRNMSGVIMRGRESDDCSTRRDVDMLPGDGEDVNEGEHSEEETIRTVPPSAYSEVMRISKEFARLASLSEDHKSIVLSHLLKCLSTVEQLVEHMDTDICTRTERRKPCGAGTMG